MPVFPAEIIQSIVEELPTPVEQAKMCLVSRQCKAISLPVLYRHVKIRTLRLTTRFCSTVNQFAERGKYLRSFVVVPETGAENWSDLLDFTALRRALPLFHQLEYLHIWLPAYGEELFHSFTILTLPRLRRFTCHQPGFSYDHLLGDFLVRHATSLTELCIIRPFAYQWDNPDLNTADMSMSLPMMHLPALQSYSGSYSFFLRLVIRGRRLTHASFWDIPRSSLDRTVLVHRLANALAHASEPLPGPGLNLSILGDAFGAEAMPILARALPNLRTLEIGPFLSPPCRLHPSTLPTISSALPHLPFLTMLSMHNSADLFDPIRAGGNRDEMVKQDAAVLAVWAKLCPSLVATRLHNQYWQRRPVPGSQWFMIGH